MAQLKDTIVSGSLRATDTIYTTTLQTQIINAPTTSNSTTYGPGTNDQVLKSNGTSVYWTTLGGASGYSVTDSSSASAIGTGTSLVTERDVYYGLPTINNAHNYTSGTTIYAPTAGGTANYVLMGNGTTAAPIWKTPKDALNIMINALDTGNSVLTSNDYIITQYVGGGTTTTTYHRRPASAVRVGGLLTARKLKVALNSTTDVTFDGTADQTSIPINGTLSIANGGTGATTAAGIREALGLSNAMHFIGTTTTTMSDGLTTANVTINSATHTPIAGDVVLYSDTEYVWTGSAWERLGRDSSFKTTQTAITKPSAATNKWVSAIGQDANGVISVDYGTLDTSGNWSGLAAKATGVVDAGSSSRVLTIRYGGNGAAATDWIPMHDSNGNLIPVSSTNLANKVRDKASGDWNITAATATADADGNNIIDTYLTKTAYNTGAKGDIIYWSATNTPAHLTNTSSTTKNFLSITSQVPAWTTLSKSDVGLGNVTNDAQVKASLGTTKGDLLYWSAKDTPARLAIGTNGYFLTVSSGVPAWSALPTASTGTAGIMKVGTGLSASSGTVSVSYGTAASTALQGNATLVTLNGTNKNASSVASFYAPTSAGTSGQYLKSSGSGAPTWDNLPTLSATSSGSGNVVTAISASNHAITYTLGTISTVSAQIIRW